jgi:hypothetical protein
MVCFLGDLRHGPGHGDSTVNTASGLRGKNTFPRSRFRSTQPLSLCPVRLLVAPSVAEADRALRWVCILVLAPLFRCAVLFQSVSVFHSLQEETTRKAPCEQTACLPERGKSATRALRQDCEPQDRVFDSPAALHRSPAEGFPFVFLTAVPDATAPQASASP